MSTGSRRLFWIGFTVVILLIAGGVSYFASSSPDGLDSATLQGCEVVETPGVKNWQAAASPSTPRSTRWPPPRWPTMRWVAVTAPAVSPESPGCWPPRPLPVRCSG